MSHISKLVKVDTYICDWRVNKKSFTSTEEDRYKAQDDRSPGLTEDQGSA